MKKQFYPKVPYNYIQSIRLVHALMESKFDIRVPKEHAFKFKILKDKFGVQYSIAKKDTLTIDEFKISHIKPLTSIGSIQRPLIFPHSIMDYCRSIWKNNRDLPVSFAGLLTKKRKKVIEEWCKLNSEFNKNKLNMLAPNLYRLSNKIRKLAGIPVKDYTIQIGNLHLLFSERGRYFPIKSWDEAYYQALSNSKFVLCPSGDYVWTYRFFESILCGAIPIVEETCEAYKGFIFIMMNENMGNNYIWDKNIAEYNYNLCCKRISIPISVINKTLKNLIFKWESYKTKKSHFYGKEE
jgi:hypothetical protein